MCLSEIYLLDLLTWAFQCLFLKAKWYLEHRIKDTWEIQECADALARNHSKVKENLGICAEPKIQTWSPKMYHQSFNYCIHTMPNTELGKEMQQPSKCGASLLLWHIICSLERLQWVLCLCPEGCDGALLDFLFSYLVVGDGEGIPVCRNHPVS